MSEPPKLSGSQSALGELRSAYQSLEPSDALLRRVETRLASAAPRPSPVAGSRTAVRFRAAGALLTIAALAATVWASWRAESPSAPKQPNRLVPSVPEPKQPSLPLRAVQDLRPSQVSEPQQPIVEIDRRHWEAEEASSASPLQQPPAFFEIETTAWQGHTTSDSIHCLATRDEYAVFAGLGFSAAHVPNTLLGDYSCEIRWDQSTDEFDLITMALRRESNALGPLISCETGKGIRVPISATVDLLFEGERLDIGANVLLHSQEEYSLSFTKRLARWGLVETNEGVVPRRQNISFTFILIRGPWFDLSEHRVLQATVSYRGQGSRKTGELTCHKSQ